MIIRKIDASKYKIIAESNYDLINLTLLLNKSDITLIQKQRIKKNDEEKKSDIKPKTTLLCMKNISHFKFVTLDAVAVKGQYKNKMITRTIYAQVPFYLEKKLTKNEKKFLRNLDAEKTYYLAADVNTIQFGYVKNYEFTELYHKEFSFKNIDYRKEMLAVVDKFRPLFLNSSKATVFKCLPGFVKDLTRWTNLDWRPIDRDVSLDWEACTPAKIKQKKFIDYLLKRKKVWVQDETALWDQIRDKNIKQLFVNPAVDVSFYNNLVLKLPPQVLKIVPYTKQISYFLPAGFIGLRYF